MTWPDGLGVVVLPDGRRVRGRGLRNGSVPGQLPDFGVYLLKSRPDPVGWDERWVRWPDFRNPTDRQDACAALREAYERSVSERVEIACHGGVGRTGTALAALAVFAGIPTSEAVAWVRAHYQRRAVETPWQRRWVLSLASHRD